MSLRVKECVRVLYAYDPHSVCTCTWARARVYVQLLSARQRAVRGLTSLRNLRPDLVWGSCLQFGGFHPLNLRS